MPTIPEVPGAETPAPEAASKQATAKSLEADGVARSKTFAMKLPSSNLGKHRLKLAHMHAARSEHEDTTAYITDHIEMTEDSSVAVQSITNEAGELLRDGRNVAGVLITAPPSRPPLPVSDDYLIPRQHVFHLTAWLL